MDCESVERSSAHCAVAKGELRMDLGEWKVEGDLIDLYTDLPPLLPPSSEPSVTPISMSRPERAPVPSLSQERAPVPEFSPERAPVSLSSQRGLPFLSLAQRGLLFPCPSQRGLLFLSLAQRGLLSPHPAQRGLLFPRPAQRETQFRSAALSFPCQSCSPCWESQFSVCGQRTPALKARRLTNARPHVRSCLLHHCRLAAALLALSPPSVRWELRRSAILHRHRGWRIPCLRLQPLSPGLRLGPSTQLLHHGSKLPPLRRGPSVHWLRWAPSSLWLCLGLSSTIHRLGTPLLWLRLHPFGSTSVLCRSGSTAAFRIPASASVAWATCCIVVLWILPVALAHQLSVSASGSSTTCSAAVGWPPEVVSPSSSMAPPSVGSTVGCHHGCGLGPTWLLLLQVPPVVSLAPPTVWSALAPPVSSLAPPSVVSILDSVRQVPTHPSLCCSYGVRMRLPGRGRYVTPINCQFVCFPPHMLPLT